MSLHTRQKETLLYVRLCDLVVPLVLIFYNIHMNMRVANLFKSNFEEKKFILKNKSLDIKKNIFQKKNIFLPMLLKGFLDRYILGF